MRELCKPRQILNKVVFLMPHVTKKEKEALVLTLQQICGAALSKYFLQSRPGGESMCPDGLQCPREAHSAPQLLLFLCSPRVFLFIPPTI